MKVDYAPEAIEQRLREVAQRTDLTSELRMHAKIDYSADAIEHRLRTVEALRRACLLLAAEPDR